MKNISEHFRRLGLREDASWEEIESAFNQKVAALRRRTFEDDPRGKKKDKERRLLIRSYYALQEYEENGRVIKRGLKNPSNKDALLLLCLGICIIVGVVSCNHDFETYDDQIAESYVHLSSCTEPLPADLEISKLAAETVDLLNHSGTPWHTSNGGKYYTEPDDLILEEADRFAQCYVGLASFADVEAHLCQNYDNFKRQYYKVDEGELRTLKERIDMVCAFYGFYTQGQAYGKKNPYTKKGIGMYHTYLQYLCTYKENYEKETI